MAPATAKETMPTSKKPRPASAALPPEPRRAESGTRQRSLPPFDDAAPESAPPAWRGRAARSAAPAPDESSDPMLDENVFALVTAVAASDGMLYGPKWAEVAHEAKRRGYLNENSLRLFITNHGRQYLSVRAQPRGTGGHTMVKLDPAARLQLRDLRHDTGVLMQEAIGHILSTVHEHRDELTRVARSAGRDYPWEAIEVMLRERRAKR